MLKIFILSFIVLAHPLHVSLLSVEYSEKSDSFNVFLKIYADDFLLDYRLLTGDDSTRFDFIAKKDTAETLLRKYLYEKVQIFAEGKKLNGKLLKLESTDGELRMNLIFNNKKSKNYLVRNLIMTDLYKDQSNLLIFRYGDYEEGIRLTADKPEQTFIVK